MLLFDHLVHAVNCTPEEAAKQMQERGFHTALGGEHTTWVLGIVYVILIYHI